jgi:hypothetical protein
MMEHIMRQKMIQTKVRYFFISCCFFTALFCSCEKEKKFNDIEDEKKASFLIDFSFKDKSIVLNVNNENDTIFVWYFYKKKLVKESKILAGTDMIKQFKYIVKNEISIKKMGLNQECKKIIKLENESRIEFSIEFNDSKIIAEQSNFNNGYCASKEFQNLLIRLKKKNIKIDNYLIMK